MEEKLIQYLSTLENDVNSIKEFVVDQLPDVINQYLSWYFMQSMIYGTCGLIITISLWIGMVLCLKVKCDYTWEKDGKYIAILILGIASILPAAVTTNNYMNAIKVKIAPKVVILEKISELRK